MTKNKSRIKKFFLIVSVAISCLFLSLVCFVSIVYNKYDLDISKLTTLNNGVSVVSASGNDHTLYNTNRSIVDIDALPEYVKNAFIAIEDKNFYNHNGYDIKRIIKSSFVNITTQSKSQGASTISQQLIKNALLTNEKTYSRKVKEIILSIKMEKNFSKDEILEMYLNTIYFGSNAYGIENASKIYFNKSAKDLNINESCCLAGLIKSPAYYSPITHYDRAFERKNIVAFRMLKTNKISKSEYEEIINSDIVLATSKNYNNSYEKEAIFEACRLLNITERELINRKYKIVTFKQDDLQKEVVDINNEILNNAETNTNSTLDSLSVVASNDGHILAYYSNSTYNLHNLKRQPASTLKPFAVYLPCFKHNILSPSSQILDEPINYNGFAPHNADKAYHGYVSVRSALSNSLNVPAVKALDYLGVKKAKENLENFGINISNSDLNLALSLGAVKNGVNLLSLLTAYIALANQGEYTDICFVNQILDSENNVIYNHENFKTKVAESEDCFMINDILKDCAKTGTAKRLSSLPYSVASKTGTASNSLGNTDLYNIAYTSEHSIMAWVGDIDQGYLANNLLSSSQPTDINKGILEKLYKKSTPKDFVKPEGVEKCGYDLSIYETQHIVAQPQSALERYIGYDYFKTDNQPKEVISKDQLSFNVSLDKTGVALSFYADISKNYKIIKSTDNNTHLLESIDSLEGLVTIKDNNIFSHNAIEYYITDENGVVLSEIRKVKPKEFLINLLNNEILSSKRKWLV